MNNYRKSPLPLVGSELKDQLLYRRLSYCFYTIVNNLSDTLNMEIMKAVLGLEDGQCVVGEGFGVEGEVAGELVFNTQMTGYMESLTDPSYAGQILMFTFPLIGNYGVDHQNFQNPRVCALGCVTREICQVPGAEPSIRSFFEEQGLL